MSDPRTALVAAGYDAMIDTWEAWKARIADDPRAEWCGELLCRLAPGAKVVELGCGGGTPETQRLARHLLSEAGLRLLRDELVTIREHEGDATFHWVLARR